MPLMECAPENRDLRVAAPVLVALIGKNPDEPEQVSLNEGDVIQYGRIANPMAYFRDKFFLTFAGYTYHITFDEAKKIVVM